MLEKIELKDIKIANPYLRTNTDINSLKKSIETIGLINPITVNSKNELLAGARRYQAMIELGYKETFVQRVDLNELEQELVSIDENLVRCPLNKLELEQCLNRGREIYEKLNPAAVKIDLEIKNLSASEKKAQKEEEENDTTSFAAITSEKTGLSKAVIKSAIKRDEASSETIKKARGSGELSASQVNEVIKLSKEEQDMILPHIKEKSVKDVRKIVEQARKEGIKLAIASSTQMQELPRELTQLEKIVKNCNKQFSKLIIENLDADGEDFEKILNQVKKLKLQSAEFLKLYSFDGDYIPTKKTERAISNSIQ